jgi:hypothetical protein
MDETPTVAASCTTIRPISVHLRWLHTTGSFSNITDSLLFVGDRPVLAGAAPSSAAQAEQEKVMVNKKDFDLSELADKWKGFESTVSKTAWAAEYNFLRAFEKKNV